MRIDDGPVRPGSQSALRSANQRRVVDLLKSMGEVTQARLARETGLAPATVSNIVRELTESGVLDAADVGKRGRVLRFARSAGLVVGVDIGPRGVRVALADMSHAILAQRRAPLDPAAAPAAGLAVARRLLDGATAELGVARQQVVGIGLGVPGPVDPRTGRVGRSAGLPGWVGAVAAEVGATTFDGPVGVDDVTNLAALAEFRWGAGRGARNVVQLTLGDRVGAGIILDGKLIRGRDGTAGEIGHSTVDEFGVLCRCGNRGCLETVAGARAVAELLAPVHGPGLGTADVLRLVTAGDPACVRALADAGRRIGAVVGGLCAALNPDRILLGGELAAAGEVLTTPLRTAARRHGIPSSAMDLPIVPAALGGRAAVLGAVALALDGPLPTMSAEVS
ncbi:ROK family transcriptional regulator [Skermania piniformis]|uniref:ROK family transcriptional regulator n=1 Tax=Skermania pinensis TaxID=39122 RepID=A0ABX8S754_9ACTN|nr:ROK family transcriptional regulator [Skermania piniformis]QXQ13673.1 ROK family transcriptional regulator [Skermania piniformis]